MISKYTSKILSIFLIVFTAYNAHGQGTEDFGNLTTGKQSMIQKDHGLGQDGSTWTVNKFKDCTMIYRWITAISYRMT